MKPLRASLPFLAFLAVAAWTFVAGASALAQPPAPRPVTVRFLFLEEECGGYYFRVGETFQKIGDTPYVISGPQLVPAGEPVRLFKDYPDPKTGMPARTEILSVKPPATAVSALVVVKAQTTTSAESGRPAYQATFYNSDTSAFPAGSLRIINLGRSDLVARFGTEQLTLSPTKIRIVKPTFDARRRVRTYVGAALPGGGWQLIYDSITSLRPDQRMTGVLVYSPSGMRHTHRAEDLAEGLVLKPGHFWLTYSETPPPPPPAG
jgi:hypothetical protein